MESKIITAADVRKSISKRQIDFLANYILNGELDPQSGILAEIDLETWKNENQMADAKILEEAWEAIYINFGMYAAYNSDGSIVIRIFPEDKNILIKYPIRESEIWEKCKEKIREFIFKNDSPFTPMFSEFLIDFWSIITKEEWLEIQKEAINKAIAEMQESKVAQNIASVYLNHFSSEAIKYAEGLGFEVERESRTETYNIKLTVPNTKILKEDYCFEEDSTKLGWFE